MGRVDQPPALLLARLGSDEQNGGSTIQARQTELVLVHHEFLVEDGQRDAALAGPGDKLRASAEVLRVGQDAERRRAVPLVTQRDDGGVALLLDPTLRRRLPLELRDDAAGGSYEGRCHRHRLRTRQDGLHPALQDAQGHIPFQRGDFDPFVRGYFVEDVHLSCSVPRTS